MKIYFVRHGESEGNVGPFVQGREEPLTIEGIEQANTVAERFKGIPVDIILSSPENRAKMTAEIISKDINTPIEFNDLLIEQVKPSVILKKLKKDPEVKEIKKLIKENFHTLEWRHSDEENFEDFKKRGIELLDYLATRKEENILITTHGIFMRILIALVVMGNDLTSHEYWKFFVTLFLDNTGITIIKSNDGELYEDTPRWELISWNDHGHLTKK